MYKLKSTYRPCGDQPQAIKKLTGNLAKNTEKQVLLGVTGSGKTFTLANVIAKSKRSAIVISHNKTLAAQLYTEFKEFFPHNAVEYFVSYYDYYQPEAYIPTTDTYIEKDSSVNDRLDCLRLSATSSLMSRKDVIIVASVSCIYNLGSPEDYREALVFVERGQQIDRDSLLLEFIQIQYERNDTDFSRGKFRVRGDVIELFPAYRKTAVRIELSDNIIKSIVEIDPLTREVISEFNKIGIYPAKHFIISSDRITATLPSIKKELEERLLFLRKNNKLIEAQRLESRTNYDLEMLSEIGYCHGVENYSRHLSGRPAGSRPSCLLDYFESDFLTIIDESHVTIPQIRGMYEGDKARKETLVRHGFRLPSCLDNRPLKFTEFESLIKDTIYVSATPSEFEIHKSKKEIVEQIIRPTGLLDPYIEVRKTDGQIDDLINEIEKRTKRSERTLVTTLTKRMSEDLSAHLKDKGLKVKYLHSEIKTIERTRILKELRQKKFDCLVGINLLREGLDLPEVSLIVILDADKEGFLRSDTSLIQTAGRAARHINGYVIMYADRITGSMKRAIDETTRRRKLQLEFNKKHKIEPRSIKKAIMASIEQLDEAEEVAREATGLSADKYELEVVISDLEREMELSARNLQFERAIELREQLNTLKKK